MTDSTQLTNVKLLTIIAPYALADMLMDDLTATGARGYTSAKVDGQKSRVPMDGATRAWSRRRMCGSKCWRGKRWQRGYLLSWSPSIRTRQSSRFLSTSKPVPSRELCLRCDVIARCG